MAECKTCEFFDAFKNECLDGNGKGYTDGRCLRLGCKDYQEGRCYIIDGDIEVKE